MSADPDPLADVGTVVRRTLAARTNDSHLIDDLTQETLLRITRRQPQLSPDERRAYAVVTARNLLATHFRRRSVQDRHLHQLIEHDRSMDPEQHTLDNEESQALCDAMDRIDPGERELLVRHEVGGTDLATLADEASVSNGAIAMRLARARANLRLEFLLVFRRLGLPTERCRPVLLALAAGDRRRQAQLGAVEHVDHCPTCASLLDAMTERDRRVAGWLLIPVGSALRRVWRLIREHWVTALTAVLVAVATVGVVAVVDGPRRSEPRGAAASVPVATGAAGTADAPPRPSPPTAAPTPAVVPAPPAPATPPTPAPPPPTTVEAPVTEPPPTTSEAPATEPPCPPPQPLAQLDAGRSIGCPFAVSIVTVVAASGTHLSAIAGSRSVSIDVTGAQLPALVVPGVSLRVSGVVENGSGGQLSVSVQADDLHVDG